MTVNYKKSLGTNGLIWQVDIVLIEARSPIQAVSRVLVLRQVPRSITFQRIKRLHQARSQKCGLEGVRDGDGVWGGAVPPPHKKFWYFLL